MPKKDKVQAAQPRPSTPMSARVQEDEDFRPLAISREGKVLEVVSIDERVEEEAEWWEPEPITTWNQSQASYNVAGCGSRIRATIEWGMS